MQAISSISAYRNHTNHVGFQGNAAAKREDHWTLNGAYVNSVDQLVKTLAERPDLRRGPGFEVKAIRVDLSQPQSKAKAGKSADLLSPVHSFEVGLSGKRAGEDREVAMQPFLRGLDNAGLLRAENKEQILFPKTTSTRRTA